MLSRRSLVLALAGLGAIIGALLLFQPDGTSSSPLQLGGGAKPLFVPVAVSYQGGGWRAMFACMGVTRALSRAGVFGPEYARQLQVLSSNSGGSWFLSQLAYSESFYGNVTGEEHQVAQMVHDWMGKQRSQLQPPSEKVIENLKQWLGSTSLEGRALVLIFKLVDWFRKRPLLTSLLCWSVRKQWAACELMLSATVGGISLGAETQGSWHLMIERMLNTADPTFKDKTATTKDRHAKLTGPELRIQIANMTSSFANYDARKQTSLSWRLTDAGGPASMMATPITWSIAGAADARNGWVSEPISISEAARSAVNSAASGGWQTAPLPPVWLGTDAPPVSAVAALSSAAGALLGSANWTVAMARSFINGLEQAAPDSEPGADAICSADDKAEMAQAAEELVNLLELSNPSKEVDSYSQECQDVLDNYCKKLYPPFEDPIHFVRNFAQCVFGLLYVCTYEDYLTPVITKFQDMAPCVQEPSADVLPWAERRCEFPHVRMADGGYVDNTAVATAIAGMQAQAQSQVKKLRVVAVANDDCTPPQCVHESLSMLFRSDDPAQNPVEPSPPPLVFDLSWSDVRLETVPGTQYVSIGQASTMTLENEWYGVEGGWPVEVLLISVDAPVSIVVGVSTDSTTINKMADASQEASSAGVTAYIQAWLRSTQ